MKTFYKNIILLFIIVIPFSCSPSQKVSGNYSGTYSSANLPILSGNGTIVIESIEQEKVNITFTSNGNPPIYVQGGILAHEGGLVTSYDIYSLDSVNGIWGYMYPSQNHSLHLQYYNSATYADFYFDGHRQ